ncbi:MAG: ABC transporter permease [Alphaproteobacteria bacterium]|nr:MAG: ABC transporter permease [Alphaproteobacteria bacterium]
MTARPNRARRLTALIVKESLQVIRDPSSILVAFLLPLMLIFLFGYGLSLDNDRIEIGLVVEDMTPETLGLAQSFFATRFLDVRAFARDRRTLEDDLVAGRIRGLVVIPATFAERFMSGREARVEVVADGSDPNTASFIQNYARGVVRAWLADRDAARGGHAALPVSAEPRVWFNAALKSRNMLLPGSIAVIMTLVGTLLTALVVAREWERGTMEALMATPVSMGELLLGKLVPYFFLGLGAMGMCVILALTVFDVTFRGSLAALLLVSAVFLFPALGQGLLISAVAKNQFIASHLALLSGFLPSFVLSGLVFEIDSMPTPIRLLTYIVQARYFVSSLKTTFLAGDIWALILPDLGAMMLIGAVFFFLALRSTRKRLD